jgi:hypothetical protein
MRSGPVVVLLSPDVERGAGLTATALSAALPPAWPQAGNLSGAYEGTWHEGAQRRTDPS